MEELILVLIGLVSMYAFVHFTVLAFTTTWADMTGYQRVVSIVGVVSAAIMFLSQAGM